MTTRRIPPLPDRPDAPGLSRRGLMSTLAVAAGGAGLSALVPAAARARTTLDARLDAAYQRRLAAADRMAAAGSASHSSNGDEERYPSRFASYSKGLPHDSIGEVLPGAFAALTGALASGHPDDFEAIPLGGARRLVNPQAGLAFDTEGADPHQLAIPPAPRFDSAEEAGEMVELYWMALLRDVPFVDWHRSPLVRAAIADLERLSDFRGPRRGGRITVQTLFRDVLPGATDGPYVSQFLLRSAPFGSEYVERRMRTTAAGVDHGTSFEHWLAINRGEVPTAAVYAPARRHLCSGRDLAEWVHVDVLFQAYFNAGLILGAAPDSSSAPSLGGIGCPLGPGNPYHGSLTQDPFGTWGAPAIQALLCEVATRALKAVWFQKWLVHRRLRPETFAGRVHVDRQGWESYPIHSDLLASDALVAVEERYGSHLLPLAFPEGSPVHPAYGAGHATVAGACVTVLKACFDESFPISDAVVPAGDGERLLPFVGELTVGAELNKLASNVATGRNIAGVHWRTDAYWSLRLGEQVAIALLTEHLASLNEGGGYRFTSFDGEAVEIVAG